MEVILLWKKNTFFWFVNSSEYHHREIGLMMEQFHQKNYGSDVNNSVYGLVICSAVVHKQRKLYSLIFLHIL